MYESEIPVEDELLTSGEIPRDQWDDFLERFAADYEGWVVDVEWPGADELEADEDLLGDDVEYTLEGIDSDIDVMSGRISIHLSQRRTIHLDAPVRIARHEPNGRSRQLLAIQASGLTCNLHLRNPEIGESLDIGEEEEEQERAAEGAQGIELPI